jgi:site-specific recombinase XerD
MESSKQHNNETNTYHLARANMIYDFEEYLQRRGYMASSIVKYKRDCIAFFQWALLKNLLVNEIDYNEILEFIKTLKNKNKAKTISCKINSIKHYFEFLLNIQRISYNPVSDINLKGSHCRKIYNLLGSFDLAKLHKDYSSMRKNSKTHSSRFSFDSNVGKRNKTILGLISYQGLTTKEIENLEVSDIHLERGEITVKSNHRYNGRVLKLEASQIIEFSDYIALTRKKINSLKKNKSCRLFFSTGSSYSLSNTMKCLLKTLKEHDLRISSFRQIRASVITHWVKEHNLREAQHMTGHKHVSSTEQYISNHFHHLFEDVCKFHPVI